MKDLISKGKAVIYSPLLGWHFPLSKNNKQKPLKQKTKEKNKQKDKRKSKKKPQKKDQIVNKITMLFSCCEFKRY